MLIGMRGSGVGRRCSDRETVGNCGRSESRGPLLHCKINFDNAMVGTRQFEFKLFYCHCEGLKLFVTYCKDSVCL